MARAIIKWGDPRLPERFWTKTKVNPVTGCWEWQQSLDKDGYPQLFHVSGSGPTCVQARAHRHAYQVLVGPIGEETLNHDCYTRHCVNPNTGHAATPMSLADNVREAKARIECCPKNHPYDEANTMFVGPKKNRRACRTCYNERSRAYWHNTRKDRQKDERRAAGYQGGYDETSTCKRNHPRTPENTYVTPAGHRTCKVCRRENVNAHAERKRK